MTAISAHQGGAGRGARVTREVYERAARLGAEYVELDVRRTADGEFVAHHDDRAGGRLLSEMPYDELCAVAGHPVPRVREVFELITGRAIGHVDLKETGWEDTVTELAIDILGAGNFVVTTGSGQSIARISERYPAVRTALSFGRGDLRRAIRYGTFGRYLLRRVRDCGADWAAVNHCLTRTGLLRACAAHDIGVMVWTVNDPPKIQQYLTDPRITVLITDTPAKALQLRDDPR